MDRSLNESHLDTSCLGPKRKTLFKRDLSDSVARFVVIVRQTKPVDSRHSRLFASPVKYKPRFVRRAESSTRHSMRPELVQDSSPIHLNSPDLIEELVSEFCSSLTTFESSVLQGIASGHSYSDISKLLCCPLKAVDNGIQRAKRKILTNRDC
jgi:hypothetical protein